jgi:hypothetical protein
MSWVPPTFTEIDMSAEIGSYQEDFEPPAERDFVAVAAKSEPFAQAAAERADE